MEEEEEAVEAGVGRADHAAYPSPCDPPGTLVNHALITVLNACDKKRTYREYCGVLQCTAAGRMAL